MAALNYYLFGAAYIFIKEVRFIKIVLKIFKNIIIFLLIQLLVFCTFGVAMIFYGPFTNLKELYVTSAMTTYSHQYLAKIFLSDKEVNEIMEKNKINNEGKSSNEADIQVFATNIEEENYHEVNNEPNKNSNNNENDKIKDKIDFVDISNDKFKGYALIINNPKRVKIGTIDKIGNYGMKLDEIVKKYNAVGAINGGGFVDPNGVGNGGTPTGLVIADGKVIYGNENEKYDVIGFNQDSVMVLGQYTLKQVREKNIRDAVSFDPFLIVNGEPMIKEGNGGWGLAPRTAIGQRKDGAVVMLVIDGRQISSIGATLKDVQDILLKMEVYNAANLDGGASTQMIYDGKTINNPCSSAGPRYMPTAFIIQ